MALRSHALVWIAVAVLPFANFGVEPADAAVVSTSGSISFEASPYPSASDTEIFVFDEQQSVAFVASQPLDFGGVSAGTLVNSHYLQFDPASTSTVAVGMGTVTFDAPILAVITTTAFLNADLSPDVSASSDQYFGLEDTLGPYFEGGPGTARFRGLGSPQDDLEITIGSDTLVILSLEVPVAGAIDGIRVLTAIPEPATALLVLGGGLALARRPKPRVPLPRVV